MAQISSTKSILTDDFNADGYTDILLLGNDSEISTQLGRQDASTGIILLNDGKGNFKFTNKHDIIIKGASRSHTSITIKDSIYYIIDKIELNIIDKHKYSNRVNIQNIDLQI